MARQIKQKKCIKTERLELKSFRSCDLEQIKDLLTNEEIAKTFMVPEFESEKQVRNLANKLIENSKPEDTAHLEYGVYLNDTLIGFINNCEFGEDEIEIGYVIHPDHKGQGYATEAVSAVIQDLFRMGFTKVVTGYFEKNTASRRVMEKCGMHQIERSDEVEYRGVNHVCRYFEITNPETN